MQKEISPHSRQMQNVNQYNGPKTMEQVLKENEKLKKMLKIYKMKYEEQIQINQQLMIQLGQQTKQSFPIKYNELPNYSQPKNFELQQEQQLKQQESVLSDYQNLPVYSAKTDSDKDNQEEVKYQNLQEETKSDINKNSGKIKSQSPQKIYNDDNKYALWLQRQEEKKFLNDNLKLISQYNNDVTNQNRLRRQNYIAQGQNNINIDRMTYEEILEFQEKIGFVKCGLSQDSINSLQENIFDGKEQSKSCTICLDNYQQNEFITQLPCSHNFHSICVKNWLQESKQCPICKIEINEKLH